MNIHLNAISKSVQEINRSLLLLQTNSNAEQNTALEVAMDKINEFETIQMHAVRMAMEDT